MTSFRGRFFLTQDLWRQSGDMDSAVARVLAPGVMEKVRSKVGADDAPLEADVARGLQDHLTQTPSLVIVAGGSATGCYSAMCRRTAGHSLERGSISSKWPAPVSGTSVPLLDFRAKAALMA